MTRGDTSSSRSPACTSAWSRTGPVKFPIMPLVTGSRRLETAEVTENRSAPATRASDSSSHDSSTT